MESPEIVVSLGYLWTALNCTLAESPKNRLIVHTIRYLNGFELLNIKAISNVIVKFAFHSSEPREKKRLSWCYKSYLYVFSRSCGVCVPYTIRDHNRWHGEKSILLKSHLCERVLALSLPTNLYRSHIKKRKAETKFAWKK